MEDLTWEQSLRGLSVTEAVPQKLATLRNARNKLEAAAEEVGSILIHKHQFSGDPMFWHNVLSDIAIWGPSLPKTSGEACSN